MDPTLTCELCYLPFNDHLKIPRILTNCGHTFCQQCLESLSENRKAESKSHAQCSKCKANFNFSYSDTSDMSLFPKNFSILEIIQQQAEESNCTHQDKCIAHICLDSNCKIKNGFCLSDSEKKHKNCKKELIIPIEKFKELVDIGKFTTKASNWDDMKKHVEIRLDLIKNQIFDFIDLSKKCVDSQMKMLDNLDYQKFVSSFNLWESHFDKKTKKITLNYKKQYEIKKFCSEIDTCLRNNLPSSIQKAVYSILPYAARTFLEFRAIDEQENEKLLSQILKSSFVFREHFILRDFDCRAVQTMDDFFINVKKAYVKSCHDKSSSSFACFSNGGSELANLAMEKLNKHWSDDFLNDNVKEKVLFEFEKHPLTLKSNWGLEVFKNDFSSQMCDAVNDILYMRNEFCIRIFEKVKPK